MAELDLKRIKNTNSYYVKIEVQIFVVKSIKNYLNCIKTFIFIYLSRKDLILLADIYAPSMAYAL